MSGGGSWEIKGLANLRITRAAYAYGKKNHSLLTSEVPSAFRAVDYLGSRSY